MRPVTILVLVVLASAGARSDTPPGKKSPPPAQKKAAPPPSKAAAPAQKKAAVPAQKKAAPNSGATARKGTTSKKSSPRYAARPRTQAAPTQDRYKQIQQALAQKGYLQAEPSGVWGSESAEALKKFQQDQNLNPTGKLDSLSLIALGLGPKRENGPQTRTEPK